MNFNARLALGISVLTAVFCVGYTLWIILSPDSMTSFLSATSTKHILLYSGNVTLCLFALFLFALFHLPTIEWLCVVVIKGIWSIGILAVAAPFTFQTIKFSSVDGFKSGEVTQSSPTIPSALIFASMVVGTYAFMRLLDDWRERNPDS